MKCATVFGYAPRDPLPLFEARAEMPPEERQRFLDLLGAAGLHAKKRGVPLALEAINRYESRYGNTLAECRDLIDAVADVCEIGILADFFHLSIEERDPYQAILESGGYIRHVHLGENNRLLPGHGAVDWERGFAALRKIGYDGYAALECGIPGAPERLLPECLALLRRL